MTTLNSVYGNMKYDLTVNSGVQSAKEIARQFKSTLVGKGPISFNKIFLSINFILIDPLNIIDSILANERKITSN